MDYKLKNVPALITGAGGDIGRAIARTLAVEGAVLGLSGRDPERLRETASAVELDGGVAHLLPGDLAEPEVSEGLVPGFEELAGGKIGILVLNHSSMPRMTKVFALTPEEVRAALAADLEAVLTLTRHATPSMMGQRWGRIVLVSSASAVLGQGKAPLYTTIKSGLEGLVRNLAIDFGRFGITANSVEPGFIDTSRLRERAPDDEHQAPLRDAAPADRLGEPQEVAAAVAFLCGRTASFVNGSTLMVTGGAHLMNLW